MKKGTILRFKKLTKVLSMLFEGLFRLLGHVLFVGLVTLLGPGCVWGVMSETQHWATWSNGYQRIFRPTKSLMLKFKNHDNSRINI